MIQGIPTNKILGNRLLKNVVIILIVLNILLIGFFAVPFEQNNIIYADSHISTQAPLPDSSVSGNAPNETVTRVTEETTKPNWFAQAMISAADVIIGNAFQLIMQIAFFISGLILKLSGFLLEISITYNLIELTQNLPERGIEIGWSAIRDVVNMFFIFALLYIAISTILQAAKFETQKVLTNLIVVALLVNFSLFFTQLIIDTSNILAIGFYNSITINGTVGISDQFMQGLGLATIFDGDAIEALDDLTDSEGKFIFDNFNIGFIYLFGSITSIVTAGVFGAVAIMFIYRSVILTFLMVLSPLAFFTLILPETQNHFKKWVSILLSNSFFATFFMILLWVVITIVQTMTPVGSFSEGLGNIIIGGSPSTLKILLNYTIIIGLLMGALTISRKLGVYGSDVAVKRVGQIVGGGGGFAFRNTIGRAASKIATSERFRDVAAKSGFVGGATRLALKSTQGIARGSGDVRGSKAIKELSKETLGEDLGKATGKGGYETKLAEQVKSREEFGETLGERNKREYGETLSKGTLFGKFVGRKNKVAGAKIQKTHWEKELKKEEIKLKTLIDSGASPLNITKQQNDIAAIKSGIDSFKKPSVTLGPKGKKGKTQSEYEEEIKKLKQTP